jgi:hypothetical protein
MQHLSKRNLQRAVLQQASTQHAAAATVSSVSTATTSAPTARRGRRAGTARAKRTIAGLNNLLVGNEANSFPGNETNSFPGPLDSLPNTATLQSLPNSLPNISHPGAGLSAVQQASIERSLLEFMAEQRGGVNGMNGVEKGEVQGEVLEVNLGKEEEVTGVGPEVTTANSKRSMPSNSKRTMTSDMTSDRAVISAPILPDLGPKHARAKPLAPPLPAVKAPRKRMFPETPSFNPELSDAWRAFENEFMRTKGKKKSNNAMEFGRTQMGNLESNLENNTIHVNNSTHFYNATHFDNATNFNNISNTITTTNNNTCSAEQLNTLMHCFSVVGRVPKLFRRSFGKVQNYGQVFERFSASELAEFAEYAREME